MVELTVITDYHPPILECRSGVERVGDALEIVGWCGEHDTDRVLLTAAALPEAFFDLSSGFAGEFLQKLINNQVRTAGLFETDEGYSVRLREFLGEAKRGRQFRVFSSREAALDWLGEAWQREAG